jgi:signal transduction histidine kinase
METGRVMIRQGRFESAIPYLHRAHLLSREIGHSALVVETGELYYTALKNADRSRDALEVSEYLYAYRDSLQRHGSELALAQARLEYETSLAEAEKSALRSETAMKAAELGAERRIRVALVVAMAILIALSIFLGWVNSKRKELHGREHNLRIKLNEQNKILRKQDKKLREANQLKDRIFAVLGHDLRAPLANISGLMSIANSGKVAADDFRVVLQQLSSETERSLKTLQNILQWSSIKLNQNPVNASEQVVSSLIAPVIEGFAQHCKAKGVKLINLIAHDATIYVDSNQFTSIATNLLSNAIKYSPLHSEVEIGLEEGNGYRTFYVADRGAGMDAETLEGLNSKAKFTSKPGTLGEKGTGVGLRIMLDFVEAHGGQLLFEAREGGGTRVLVRLPHPPAQVAEVALDQAIS